MMATSLPTFPGVVNYQFAESIAYEFGPVDIGELVVYESTQLA